MKRRPTEIALDPARSDALRDRAEPLLSDPGDEHLGRVDPGFLGDGLHLVRIDDSWFTGDVVTKGRVGRKVDALFFAISCWQKGRKKVTHYQYDYHLLSISLDPRHSPSNSSCCKPG